MTDSDPGLRVALVLEQCWHRVPGGTASAALELASALTAMKEITPIGVAARHSKDPLPPWSPPLPVAHMKMERLALYETWHRFRFPKVEWATGRVDVIHATGLAIPPRTAPLVVTLHDLAWLRYPEFFTARGLRFFTKALDAIRLDADAVVCSSQATYRDAIDAGIDTAKLSVVPLGVHVPHVSESAILEMRHRLGIDGPYVLHLGTDEPRKNRQSLVRIAKSLEGRASVVFAGGQGWGGASDGQPRPNVQDLGFVNDADKHALLKGASVLCFPSFWEGFGLPVAEAMAHGTPVVTSVDTAMSEFTGDAAILVNPHDDDAIRDAIIAIVDDEQHAGRMGIAGNERAKEMTWENNAFAVVRLYRRLVAT